MAFSTLILQNVKCIGKYDLALNNNYLKLGNLRTTHIIKNNINTEYGQID